MIIAQRVPGMFPLARWAFVPLHITYITIALTASVYTLIAITQSLGWHSLHQNSMAQGEILALTILMLFANRLYWFIPLLIPGLYLAHSRGAWLALAFGILASFVRKPLWLLVIALAFGLYFAYDLSLSDTQRLQIWHAAWLYLTFWGNGFGSFWDLWIGLPAWHPEYAHNDYLQTVFEFGIWSVIPFVVVAWAVTRTTARDWPTFMAFLFMACFSMPLHVPMAAVIGGLALVTTLGEFNA